MKTATTRVNYLVLREILRLPSTVEITDVSDNGHECVLTLRGDLPFDGEVLVNLDYEHTTILKFRGFEKAVKALP